MPDNRSPDSAPPHHEVNATISLLGRIPETHPVRLLALSVARGEPIDNIQPLIDALLDPSPDRWRIRAVAAWALSRTPLSPEQNDAATASLLDVLEHARPEAWAMRLLRGIKRHAAITFGGGALATIFLFFLLDTIGRSSFPPSAIEVFWVMTAVVAICGLPIVLPASFLFDRSRDALDRAAAAEALGRLGQPESVGALSGALFDRSQRVRESAAVALNELLPHLVPEHHGMFGSQSIANLGRALNHPDAQLVSKVLAALSVVGTSHAIPFVRKAVQSGRTLRLRDAADEVLKVLEQRQRSESLQSTLLRPTISPDDPAQILVRPSISGSLPGAAELLLRASPEQEA
jgi:hypothetical protein